MPENEIDYVEKLTQYIKGALRTDTVNHYTALSPRRANSSEQTIVVKDDRHSDQLEIVIRKKES